MCSGGVKVLICAYTIESFAPAIANLPGSEEHLNSPINIKIFYGQKSVLPNVLIDKYQLHLHLAWLLLH